MNERKPSHQALVVIGAMQVRPTEWRYGYDLSQELGLASGTPNPILIRLPSARQESASASLRDADVPGGLDCCARTGKLAGPAGTGYEIVQFRDASAYSRKGRQPRDCAGWIELEAVADAITCRYRN